MLSVRPKIAGLVFQLYGRSVHPELFEVHRTKVIERNDYEAVLQITNAGHVVQWRHKGLLLTEVATCANQPLPEKRRLMSHPLRGNRQDRLECRGGITYDVSFSLEPVDNATFEAFQQQLQLTGTKNGLMHTFDSSGRLGTGAMSYVHVESRQRSLIVQALHTFPDDHAIVKTESRFCLPKK